MISNVNIVYAHKWLKEAIQFWAIIGTYFSTHRALLPTAWPSLALGPGEIGRVDPIKQIVFSTLTRPFIIVIGYSGEENGVAGNKVGDNELYLLDLVSVIR